MAGSRIKLQEGVLHELIDFHNGSLVAASVAVVGSREHCDHIALVSPVVAVHHKLVSTGYQFESIGMVELLRNILAKRVAGASGGNAPAASIIGIRPQEVANGTFVRDLLHSVELSDLVEGVD